MSKPAYEVAIVGSGLAGIAAACKLAEYGVKVVVMDENIHIGGQFLRRCPTTRKASFTDVMDLMRKKGFKLITLAKEKNVAIMNRTKVLAISDQNELLVEDNEKKISTIRPQIILLATGARERFLPFKGWTLPGVFSTGAIQSLVKSFGVLPSREIFVGGSGPFLFTVAWELLQQRGRVMSIIEQKHLMDSLPPSGLLFFNASRFLQSACQIARIVFARVPVRYATKIVEARGRYRLEQVVTSKVDRLGRAVPGTEKIYSSEALAVGHGFTPNIELAQVAGCEIESDTTKGGWVVKVDQTLETSVENVFAAGEITGIGGAPKSLNEGNIAALSILRRLGKEVEKSVFSRHQKKRERLLCFARYFNSLHMSSDEIIKAIPDETLICRCENVTIKETNMAIQQGHNTLGALRKALRIGMGNCQGRICTPIVRDLIHIHAKTTKEEDSEILPPSARIPVKPLAIKSLLD